MHGKGAGERERVERESVCSPSINAECNRQQLGKRTLYVLTSLIACLSGASCAPRKSCLENRNGDLRETMR